jgi:ammonia channel protein AmtB
MTRLANSLLLIGVLLTGLVTLYAGLNAASVPFAIHMGVFVAWAVAFLLWTSRRLRRP